MNFGSVEDQDETNDEIKFQLTVKNLFDPGLADSAWPSLENGNNLKLVFTVTEEEFNYSVS